MASDNWDWDLVHAASRAPPKQGGSGPFFASKIAAPLPDVLAYSSEVRPQRPHHLMLRLTTRRADAQLKPGAFASLQHVV